MDDGIFVARSIILTVATVLGILPGCSLCWIAVRVKHWMPPYTQVNDLHIARAVCLWGVYMHWWFARLFIVAALTLEPIER